MSRMNHDSKSQVFQDKLYSHVQSRPRTASETEIKYSVLQWWFSHVILSSTKIHAVLLRSWRWK